MLLKQLLTAQSFKLILFLTIFSGSHIDSQLRDYVNMQTCGNIQYSNAQAHVYALHCVFFSTVTLKLK